ncbi:MAG: carbohydrate ABC transporter permease [Arachnia sp.]
MTASVLHTRRKGVRASGVARAVGIAVVTIVFLVPLLWMLLASFKSTLQIIDPRHTLSFTPTLINFETVFSTHSFGAYILNSFIVGAGSTAIALLLGVPAAYGIARYKIRNATAFVLMARVIPGVSLLVPWYFLFSQLRMVGSYGVLILTHIFVTMPLIIAIMSGFFEGLPEDLEESAMIDGCSRLQAFLKVTLPLSVPGLATSTILAFIFSWNNFLFALVLSDRATRTLPVAIANFTSYASVDWGGLMAASVVITLPVLVIALFAQRYIVAGLTSGAMKG